MFLARLSRRIHGKIVVAAIAALSVASSAEAGPYLLMDLNSGQVLAQENAFQRWHPASLTKLMTAYVAFRMIKAGDASLNTPIQISVAASKEPPAKMGYPVGTRLTLDDAFKILMVKSANDIATAVAESLAKSVPNFAAWMNAEAARLGMRDSHFVNAHGLHSPQQYTTARDLAILVRAIRSEFPQYSGYFSLEGIQSGNSKMPNSNTLIGRFSGVDGMKTGYICPSGFNLIASATRNKRTVTAVVLGAVTQTERADTAANLLAQGFKRNSGGIALSQLQPQGFVSTEPINIRSQVCSKEAAANNTEKRDAKGRLIYNSPYLTEPDRAPNLVAIRLLPSAQPVVKDRSPAIGSLVNIPRPTPRPDYPVKRVSAGRNP